MLEPPSPALVRLLTTAQLCTPRDLRRCRSRVRRLTCDLPAFDSVWLDALLQLGRLTPFQVRLLESHRPEDLLVGPCVLVERLGSGPLGATYLARHRTSRELCVVKQLAPLDAASRDRLQSLVRTLAGFSHPHLIAPQTLDLSTDRPLLVCRYLPGLTLGELLVRRGRFPAAAVDDLARQLLDGLAALELRGVMHGDIRLANVRLTTTGLAVAVDAGVRTALDPEISVHSTLPPERYDGIAPELIGTRQLPTPQSDLYALGCMLWQLLAGRPPFPGGDPLGKIAAHRTRRIPDVRTWAPDTPAPLAARIAQLTAPDPAERPPSFAAALANWHPPTPGTRRRLVRFRRLFDRRPLPEERGTGRANPWAWVIAALLAVSGLALTLADQGARTALLSASQHWFQTTAAPHTPSAGTATDSEGLPVPGAVERRLPLPAPDPRGVIELTSAGPYEAAEISAVGPLVITGREGVTPVIHVGDRPCRLWAETVQLHNVHFEMQPPAPGEKPAAALLLVQSQSLDLRGCSFRTLPRPVRGSGSIADQLDDPADQRTAIGWKLLDSREPTAGICRAEHCTWIGPGAALFVGSELRGAQWTNCLKLGAGCVFQLAASPRGTPFPFRLQGCTVRHATALLRWKAPADLPAPESITLEATDCVFDLLADGALFEVVGAELRPELLPALQLTGEGSLASENVVVAHWIDPVSRAVTAVDGNLVDLEGLSAGPFEFVGPPTLAPTDSEIARYDAPRRNPAPPGITARPLPTRY